MSLIKTHTKKMQIVGSRWKESWRGCNSSIKSCPCNDFWKRNLWLAFYSILLAWSFRFRCCIVQSTLGMAPLNLCFNILFYVFLLSLFTRITSALFIYDRRTLLDIGHHCTNLLQDTLSTDPAWPLEILRTTEVNKGRLNNPRRWRKHRGRRAGIRNRLRKRAHSPPLPSILLANVQSLENKMDD